MTSSLDVLHQIVWVEGDPEASQALADVEKLVEAAKEILAAIETNSETGAPQYLWDALAPFTP